MFAAFLSALFALFVGIVPLGLCVGIGCVCFARKWSRPIGVWTMAGALLGTAALTFCMLLLAIGSPLLPEG